MNKKKLARIFFCFFMVFGLSLSFSSTDTIAESINGITDLAE